MEQIWLAIAVAAGVVFGFLIAWVSLRSDRANIYARGKADAERERGSLEERLLAKDSRIQEISRERAEEKELLERLREENAAIRATWQEQEARLMDTRQQADEKLALVNDSQQRLLDTLRASLTEKLNDQEARARAARVELEKARVELEALRSDNAALEASRGPLAERVREQETRIASLESELAAAHAEAESLRSENARLEAARLEAEAKAAAVAQAPVIVPEAIAPAPVAAAAVAPVESAPAAALAPVAMPQADASAVMQVALLSLLGQPAAGAGGDGRGSVEDLLKPLRASLERFDNSLAEIERSRQEALRGIKEQADALAQTRAEALAEANPYRKISRPENPAQAALEQLLSAVEASALAERSDVAGEPPNGVSIALPGGKRIAVEVSRDLDLFYDAAALADERDRGGKLTEFALVVREQLDQLSAQSSEIGIVFLPSEYALNALVDQDASLFTPAASSAVLATPNSFTALLRTAGVAWSQFELAELARKLQSEAAVQVDKISRFNGSFQEVRHCLLRTVAAFRSAAGLLSAQVLPQADRLRALSAVEESIATTSTEVVVAETPAEEAPAAAAAPAPESEPVLGLEAPRVADETAVPAVEGHAEYAAEQVAEQVAEPVAEAVAEQLSEELVLAVGAGAALATVEAALNQDGGL